MGVVKPQTGQCEERRKISESLQGRESGRARAAAQQSTTAGSSRADGRRRRLAGRRRTRTRCDATRPPPLQLRQGRGAGAAQSAVAHSAPSGQGAALTGWACCYPSRTPTRTLMRAKATGWRLRRARCRCASVSARHACPATRRADARMRARERVHRGAQQFLAAAAL